MKYSVFLSHLLAAAEQEQRTLESVLLEMQQLGFEAVEAHLQDMQREEVRKAVVGTGMKVSGIYDFLDFAHQPCGNQADELLRMALEVGAGCIMPLPGTVAPGEDRLQMRERMAEGMSQVCHQAAQQGTLVVLEDFGAADAPYSLIEEVEWFLQQIPELGFALDTGNFVYHGQDVMLAYDRLGSRIRHVHLKDHALSPKYGEWQSTTPDGQEFFSAPVGYGYMPTRELVSRLREDRYSGYMAVEQFGLRETLKGLRMAADWVKAQSV